MNFLAHTFLSGDNEHLLIGNFIADFVKGNRKNDFPESIVKGIELHREIDTFTDHHPVTSLSKHRLYPKHHKYAGPIVDIFYDHFLAKNFLLFSDMELTEFSDKVYGILSANHEYLPLKVREFLPFMIERNWLVNYATTEGIGRSLTGIGRRLSFPNKLNTAVDDLLEEYAHYEREFFTFFPMLINFVKSKEQ